MNPFSSKIIPVLALTLATQMGLGEVEQVPEYLLKARILRSLADFVTWPPISPGEEPSYVTVVGLSPFDTYLDSAFGGPPPSGLTRMVSYTRKPALLRPSRIYFICESESTVLPQILERAKGQPILTVSDTPGFAHRGVMVNLVFEKKRVSLEVNLAALRASNVQLSSHVLKRAQIVDPKP